MPTATLRGAGASGGSHLPTCLDHSLSSMTLKQLLHSVLPACTSGMAGSGSGAMGMSLSV